MNNSDVAVPVLRATFWQKVDTYDLRTIFFLGGLTLPLGDWEVTLWFFVSCFLLHALIRFGAPEWYFIELDPFTSPYCFVSVVLHWASLIGLYAGMCFYLWDPVDIRLVSTIIGVLIYAVMLLLSSYGLDFDTAED